VDELSRLEGVIALEKLAPGSWVALCENTDDPKLKWIQAELDAQGIAWRRTDRPDDPPLLEVPRIRLHEAMPILRRPPPDTRGGAYTWVEKLKRMLERRQPLDEMEDDHPFFWHVVSYLERVDRLVAEADEDDHGEIQRLTTPPDAVPLLQAFDKELDSATEIAGRYGEFVHAAMAPIANAWALGRDAQSPPGRAVSRPPYALAQIKHAIVFLLRLREAPALTDRARTHVPLIAEVMLADDFVALLEDAYVILPMFFTADELTACPLPGLERVRSPRLVLPPETPPAEQAHRLFDEVGRIEQIRTSWLDPGAPWQELFVQIVRERQAVKEGCPSH
jgi:hypothetical protein